MWASVILFLLTICFISSCLSSVTVLNRDYSYVPVRQLLAANLQAVLEVAGDVPLHPRLGYLYSMLSRNYHQGPKYGQLHHALRLNQADRPSYDVNKLNRIFPTEAEWTE